MKQEPEAEQEEVFLSTNDEIPPNNRSILNIAQIIKAVMSSAAEAELSALLINARETVHIRNTLEDMFDIKAINEKICGVGNAILATRKDKLTA